MMKINLTFLLFFFLTVTAHADIVSNLVGWWKFDEGSGTTAIDSSVNGFNLTEHNATYTSGSNSKVGPYALSFTGASTSYAEYPSNNATLATTSGTVACWFKTSSSGADSGAYIGLISQQNDYSVFMFSGKVGYYDWNGTGANYYNTTVNDGTWHHVAITFQSGVTNGTIIYVDGVSRVSNIMMTSATNDCPFEVAIGSQQVNNNGLNCGGGQAQVFHGYIDDIRVYSRVLSANDIKQLYQYSGSTLGFFRMINK